MGLMGLSDADLGSIAGLLIGAAVPGGVLVAAGLAAAGEFAGAKFGDHASVSTAAKDATVTGLLTAAGGALGETLAAAGAKALPDSIAVKMLGGLASGAARVAGFTLGADLTSPAGTWIGRSVPAWGTSPFIQGGPDRIRGVGSGTGFLFLPEKASQATANSYAQLCDALYHSWSLGAGEPSTPPTTNPPMTIAATKPGSGAAATSYRSADTQLTANASSLSAKHDTATAVTNSAGANSQSITDMMTDVVRRVNIQAIAAAKLPTSADDAMQSIIAWASDRTVQLVSSVSSANQGLAARLDSVTTSLKRTVA
jgi:hypothetical protein